MADKLMTDSEIKKHLMKYERLVQEYIKSYESMETNNEIVMDLPHKRHILNKAMFKLDLQKNEATRLYYKEYYSAFNVIKKKNKYSSDTKEIKMLAEHEPSVAALVNTLALIKVGESLFNRLYKELDSITYTLKAYLDLKGSI